MTESRKPKPKDEISPEAWEEYYAGMTPGCARMARRFPPNQCYRDKDHATAHYWIHAYSEDIRYPEAKPKVKIMHGRDSFHPGTVVFGFDPEQLVPCDCGNFEFPTDEQMAALNAYVKTLDPNRRKRVR